MFLFPFLFLLLLELLLFKIILLLFLFVNIILLEPFWKLLILPLLFLTSIELSDPLNTTFEIKHFRWVAFIWLEDPFIIRFMTSFLNIILLLLPEIVKELISFFVVNLELDLSNMKSWCYFNI